MSGLVKKVILPTFVLLAGGIACSKTDAYKRYQEIRYEREIQKANEYAYRGCDSKFDSLFVDAKASGAAFFKNKKVEEYKLDKYREHLKEEYKESPDFWALLAAAGAICLYSAFRGKNNKINKE